MAGLNGAMTLIVIATFVIIAITVVNNAKEDSEEFTSVTNETFLLNPPLKSITLYYDTPGHRDLKIENVDKYVGTKISVAEYEFSELEGINRVEYTFEVSSRILEQLDVNPETLEVYTILNNSYIKAGSERKNNTVHLVTKKLIPVALLASPNEERQLSEEEIFYNSKTPIGKAYDNFVIHTQDPKIGIISLFIILGIIMTAFLIKIERNKIPKSRSSNRSIQEYIAHARSEGLHDDEILAILVERGIKPSHASLMLHKR